ncbi:MAG: phosphatase PAP2 family protein [bacterium]|nr:phosphatase PAP2 family protein [bacterium]
MSIHFSKPGPRRKQALLILLPVVLVLCHSALAGDDDYLSTGEAVSIGAGSLAVTALGHYVKHRGPVSQPRWTSPLPLEEGLSRLLGGKPKLGKRNFLDDNFGAAMTTTGAGVLLFATDLAYPPEEKTKNLLQSQFLFNFGAFATKGVTDLFKGLVRRQRPLCYCAPDLAEMRDQPVQPDDFHSFFSGHSSSAFYSMTFLNLRVRSVMRREMSSDEYRKWRWVSPALSFGWASFVALSRIQAYKHYVSDVTVGAIAGVLMATLYYSFTADAQSSVKEASSGAPMMLQVTFSF